MTIRVLVLLVSLCLGLSGALVETIVFIAMIGEINRKRRDGETISYFGFDLLKVAVVLREYRSAYPKGKLRTYFLLACTIMIVGFLGCFVAILILR